MKYGSFFEPLGLNEKKLAYAMARTVNEDDEVREGIWERWERDEKCVVVAEFVGDGMEFFGICPVDIVLEKYPFEQIQDAIDSSEIRESVPVVIARDNKVAALAVGCI